MVKNLILIGNGNNIKEMLWLIDDINKVKNEFNVLGIVDDFKEGVLGTTDWLIANRLSLEQKYGKIYLICLIGKPQTRKDLAKKLEPYFEFANLIHPLARIHESVKLGHGVLIFSGAIASTETFIDNHSILNFDVFIAHNCKIGKYCNLSPKTALMGNVVVGDSNFFGAGAVVMPRITMGDNNSIGLGSAVIKSIENNNTLLGVPAISVFNKESFSQQTESDLLGSNDKNMIKQTSGKNVEEIKLKTFQIISDVFNIPLQEVNESMGYNSIENWDSLNHINLFLEIEERFRIKFTPKEIAELSSLKNIINKVSEKI